MTHPQFRKFIIDWGVYKTITNLPASQVAPLLYSACESSVQTSIINSAQNLFERDEETLLKVIELIVTKRVNPTVHQMNFSKLMQKENESVQDFLSRLRSLAVDCEFLCPDCEHDISFVNIRHQFIHGLFNETLQTDILAKASQLKTVEAVVNHAEAFEAALRDQSQLSSESHVSRVSEYRKNKNNSYQKSTNSYQKSNSFCNGCGSYEHGVFGKPPRNTNCHAWGKSCFNCKLPNHTLLQFVVNLLSPTHS